MIISLKKFWDSISLVTFFIGSIKKNRRSGGILSFSYATSLFIRFPSFIRFFTNHRFFNSLEICLKFLAFYDKHKKCDNICARSPGIYDNNSSNFILFRHGFFDIRDNGNLH